MNVRQLVPQPTKSEAFRRDSTRRIASASGCYVLTTVTGHVLYVGLAKNIAARFEQHLDTLMKIRPTPEGRAVLFHWLETTDLEATERGWLNSHRVLEGRLPILNKLDSPVAC